MREQVKFFTLFYHVHAVAFSQISIVKAPECLLCKNDSCDEYLPIVSLFSWASHYTARPKKSMSDHKVVDSRFGVNRAAESEFNILSLRMAQCSFRVASNFRGSVIFSHVEFFFSESERSIFVTVYARMSTYSRTIPGESFIKFGLPVSKLEKCKDQNRQENATKSLLVELIAKKRDFSENWSHTSR